jgi:putative transposase
MASSKIMRRIKGKNSRKLFEVFPELKKRYWEKNTFGQEVIFV